jgi:hypothetical protein
MKSCGKVLLGFLVWATLLTETVGAQDRQEGLGRRAQQIRGGGVVPGVRKANRNALGAYHDGLQRGAQSPLAKLREISPLAYRSAGLLPDPYLPLTPIQRILNQRNILRVRSSLGKTGTALLGRSRQGPGASTSLASAWASDAARGTSIAAVAQPTATGEAPASFEDALADRLKKAAAQNFELGMTYFREGDWARARYHFDLTKDLWLDKSRPYVASMLVSFEMGDYHQSIAELLRALQLAKTLDDLRIEGFADKFFAGDDPETRRRALSRMVDSVNRFVLGAKDDSVWKLLLAYCSWVNGDLAVAVSAADDAAQGAKEPYVVHVRRFRDMLAEEQRAAETAVTTQPVAE